MLRIFLIALAYRVKHLNKHFKRITQEILRLYAPDALVIQCGADAIVHDPLGGTNLTPEDLIECISFVMRQCNLPTILLGGGGYHFSNTSRYWTGLQLHLQIT